MAIWARVAGTVDVEEGDPIPLLVSQRFGRGSTLDGGSLSLNEECATYLVVASFTGTLTAAGQFGVQATVGGQPLAGAEASQAAAAAGTLVNVAFPFLVATGGGCNAVPVNVGFTYAGDVEGTVTAGSVTVTRIMVKDC